MKEDEVIPCTQKDTVGSTQKIESRTSHRTKGVKPVALIKRGLKRELMGGLVEVGEVGMVRMGSSLSEREKGQKGRGRQRESGQHAPSDDDQTR